MTEEIKPDSTSQAPEPVPAPDSFDAKVSQWWANNKILFFIALPIIIMFMLRDLILAMLIGSAKKTAEKAQEQDAQLQQQSQAAAQDQAKAQAADQAAADRITNRTDDDVPEDWNKKGN